MIESLLASIGPSVAYREGWRADLGPRREEQRLAAVPSTIRVKGDIQIVEAALQQLEKGWDIALFNRNSDLSATKTAQASLAALTLEMTAVNQSGLGEYGLAAPVRLVFERSTTRERSVAVSFSSAAVGFHDQVRTVYGYGHALRLGAAIQLVTVLSRATRVGANECLRAVAPEALDALPLQNALRQFREVMSKDARAAAFWLNKLRALHGRETSRAFVIDSDATTPEDEMTDIEEDSDVGSLARATALDGLPYTPHEREFAYLWATLPDEPA
jgi:hypothetical protein